VLDESYIDEKNCV